MATGLVSLPLGFRHIQQPKAFLRMWDTGGPLEPEAFTLSYTGFPQMWCLNHDCHLSSRWKCQNLGDTPLSCPDSLDFVPFSCGPNGGSGEKKEKSQPRASHILQNNLVSASGLESRTWRPNQQAELCFKPSSFKPVKSLGRAPAPEKWWKCQNYPKFRCHNLTRYMSSS